MKKSALYNYRWQKERAKYLEEHPLCVTHKAQGKVVPSAVVDHINPHRGNLELFWDKSNWQALCKQCHDRHKQRLEKSGTVIGCSDAGLPIDPHHHWNRGGGA
ncbi:HNH endonuclease signature motif containing protein [Sedimenticola selenatireducens]|uniref:Putative HNH nuclease YajD n=1 Tax=Sedimenticola selenatireducens TaxID=191960 RepID=A0A557SCJ1_9GAMM|nr:HNH endonuclease signature motif containing protein [Sedimenticola selenatireducens]TVO75127.1 HNH endonuclease [Sedimenticola selenatireducens]TVT67018.1 MAG: HNH endonuclease [Sedimenticola selenatireducens]